MYKFAELTGVHVCVPSEQAERWEQLFLCNSAAHGGGRLCAYIAKFTLNRHLFLLPGIAENIRA